MYYSADDLDLKVTEYADKILASWNYINPDCKTGFLVFMSWQQNKVLSSVTQLVIYFLIDSTCLLLLLPFVTILSGSDLYSTILVNFLYFLLFHWVTVFISISLLLPFVTIL